MSKKIVQFILARLEEPSTWQAIGFVVALTGSRFGADLDWGKGAALGATVSAILKMVIPDDVGGVLTKLKGLLSAKPTV